MSRATDYRSTFLRNHVEQTLQNLQSQSGGRTLFGRSIMAVEMLAEAQADVVADKTELTEQPEFGPLQFFGFDKVFGKPEFRIHIPLQIETTENDSRGTEVSSLTELINRRFDHASDSGERRGVLLRSLSGAGTSTEMMKAWLDCVVPEFGADTPAINAVPCWISEQLVAGASFIAECEQVLGEVGGAGNSSVTNSKHMVYLLLALSARLLDSPVRPSGSTTVSTKEAAEIIRKVQHYCEFSRRILIFADLAYFSEELAGGLFRAIEEFQVHHPQHCCVVSSRSSRDYPEPSSNVLTRTAIASVPLDEAALWCRKFSSVVEEITGTYTTCHIDFNPSRIALTARQTAWLCELSTIQYRRWKRNNVSEYEEKSLTAVVNWCRRQNPEATPKQNDKVSVTDIEKLLALSSVLAVSKSVDARVNLGLSLKRPGSVQSVWLGEVLRLLILAESGHTEETVVSGRADRSIVPDSMRDGNIDSKTVTLHRICELALHGNYHENQFQKQLQEWLYGSEVGTLDAAGDRARDTPRNFRYTKRALIAAIALLIPVAILTAVFHDEFNQTNISATIELRTRVVRNGMRVNRNPFEDNVVRNGDQFGMTISLRKRMHVAVFLWSSPDDSDEKDIFRCVYPFSDQDYASGTDGTIDLPQKKNNQVMWVDIVGSAGCERLVVVVSSKPLEAVASAIKELRSQDGREFRYTEFVTQDIGFNNPKPAKPTFEHTQDVNRVFLDVLESKSRYVQLFELRHI